MLIDNAKYVTYMSYFTLKYLQKSFKYYFLSSFDKIKIMVGYCVGKSDNVI